MGNIYIYAMTYSFSRYNASLMSMRFLLIGLGGALLMELLRRGMDSLRPQPKRLAPLRGPRLGQKSPPVRKMSDILKYVV